MIQLGYPYSYGDTLTEEKAVENLKEVRAFLQENPAVVTMILFVILPALVPEFSNFTAFAADEKLLNSLKSKSSAPTGPPTTIGFPKPRTPWQRALNTGAIGAAISVLCVNAMWVPNPISVAICLTAFTGYLVPPAWAFVLRGIRSGK